MIKSIIVITFILATTFVYPLSCVTSILDDKPDDVEDSDRYKKSLK